MKPYFRNEKGFTLIEVIVVAVIIAVLSAVAIPLYNGYIKDSRKRTAENVAGSAASFIGTAWSTLGDQTDTRLRLSVAAGGASTAEATGLTEIAAVDSIFSDATNSRRLEVLGEGAAASVVENYFIIPTDIGIHINNTSFTVTGYHKRDASNTATQPYHYRAL